MNTTSIVLALFLAVAVGLLAGLLLTRPQNGHAPAVAAGGAQLPGNHDHPVHPVLTAEETALISGFTCNCREPGCNFLPVATCGCGTASAMRTMIKRLAAENKTRDEIGRELESVWGDGIYADSAPAAVATPPVATP